MIMPLNVEKEKVSQLPDWAVDMLGYGYQEEDDSELEALLNR
jgi:hypothetical protein